MHFYRHYHLYDIVDFNVLDLKINPLSHDGIKTLKTEGILYPLCRRCKTEAHEDLNAGTGDQLQNTPGFKQTVKQVLIG